MPVSVYTAWVCLFKRMMHIKYRSITRFNGCFFSGLDQETVIGEHVLPQKKEYKKRLDTRVMISASRSR